MENRANFIRYTVCFFLNFYAIYFYSFTIFYRITLLPLLYQASNIYKLIVLHRFINIVLNLKFYSSGVQEACNMAKSKCRRTRRTRRLSSYGILMIRHGAM